MHGTQTIAIVLLLTASAGCGVCREVCRDYDATRAAAIGSGELAAGAEHVAIAFSEDALRRLSQSLTGALEDRLDAALPNVEIPLLRTALRTDTVARLTSFTIEAHSGGAAVTAGLRLEVGADLPLRGESLSLGVVAETRLRTALVVIDVAGRSMLALRLADSSLEGLTLSTTGSTGLAGLGIDLHQIFESTLRQVLRNDVMARVGDIQLVVLGPYEAEDLQSALRVERLWVETEPRRLVVAVSTDLPGIQAGPLPEPSAGDADIEVRVSGSAAESLLSAALAANGGRRFDGGGHADPAGAYAITVVAVTPEAGGLGFDYRLHRLDSPCLTADFSGDARLAWQDDHPSFTVTRHELTVASRFERAIDEAQPSPEQLSQAVTELLGRLLTVKALQLPGRLDANLAPVALDVSPDGFVVAWDLSIR